MFSLMFPQAENDLAETHFACAMARSQHRPACPYTDVHVHTHTGCFWIRLWSRQNPLRRVWDKTETGCQRKHWRTQQKHICQSVSCPVSVRKTSEETTCGLWWYHTSIFYLPRLLKHPASETKKINRMLNSKPSWWEDKSRGGNIQLNASCTLDI